MVIASLRITAFTALAAVSSAVLADDDDPVKAPYIEPGDCWSYRAENMNHQNKPIRDYELCVTLVDRSKGSVLAVASVKEDGREIDTVWSTEWVVYAGVSGIISTKGIQLYRFPLKVGDTYTMDYDFRDARFGPNAGNVRSEIKIVGWDEVAVPAGRFRALRIEVKGTTTRIDKGMEFEQFTTIWYSPLVNRHVKFQYRNPGRTSGEELTGYRLNK